MDRIDNLLAYLSCLTDLQKNKYMVIREIKDVIAEINTELNIKGAE